ncbi:PqqD family peptide modification chaperone [Nocardiopsis alkaliphila]|uniref:PqqD family peptide modification chaperone n=1 Tax=Nocardiopsis alkaliphila TaxID=225762 RepID=UPI0003457C40|nr:PqqD family peptide modification chaperone [Nocardiopsis alkaliphila]
MTEPVPAPGVRQVMAEDGAMLLDLSSGRFFGLNPTGAAMWRFLSEGTSPEERAARLAVELGLVA